MLVGNYNTMVMYYSCQKLYKSKPYNLTASTSSNSLWKQIVFIPCMRVNKTSHLHTIASLRYQFLTNPSGVKTLLKRTKNSFLQEKPAGLPNYHHILEVQNFLHPIHVSNLIMESFDLILLWLALIISGTFFVLSRKLLLKALFA